MNSASSVDLSHLELTHIPVKFHIIEGNFNCSHNHLTALTVAPIEIIESFYYYHNKISTLRKFKTKIGHNFNCTHNLIEDNTVEIDFEDKAYIGQNIGLNKYLSILNKNY